MKPKMILSFMLFLSASIFAQGTVTVTGTDLSPTFSPGTSVPIIRLSFSGITLSPIINYIKVDRTGTATNTDVPTAQLWRDLDKNDIVDGSDVQLDQTRNFQGSTTQNVQFSVLSYSPSTSENLLIVYNVAADANTSHTAGADMPADGGYITGGNETVVTFLGITTANQPLPVELTSFTAFVQNKTVILNWQTATEVNNYGFEIERSEILNEVKNANYDKGTSHSLSTSWEALGFVPGHGNSNSPKEYSFEDKNPQVGRLQYRLKQIDLDGTFEFSQTVEVNFEGPINFVLDQNYPNPFNPSTTITYVIPTSPLNPSPYEGEGNRERLVTLQVYDVLGREVATLVNDYQQSGTYKIIFDVRTHRGESLPSGIYCYMLRVSPSASSGHEFQETKKMLLMK